MVRRSTTPSASAWCRGWSWRPEPPSSRPRRSPPIATAPSSWPRTTPAAAATWTGPIPTPSPTLGGLAGHPAPLHRHPRLLQQRRRHLRQRRRIARRRHGGQRHLLQVHARSGPRACQSRRPSAPPHRHADAGPLRSVQRRHVHLCDLDNRQKLDIAAARHNVRTTSATYADRRAASQCARPARSPARRSLASAVAWARPVLRSRLGGTIQPDERHGPAGAPVPPTWPGAGLRRDEGHVSERPPAAERRATAETATASGEISPRLHGERPTRPPTDRRVRSGNSDSRCGRGAEASTSHGRRPTPPPPEGPAQACSATARASSAPKAATRRPTVAAPSGDRRTLRRDPGQVRVRHGEGLGPRPPGTVTVRRGEPTSPGRAANRSSAG